MPQDPSARITANSDWEVQEIRTAGGRRAAAPEPDSFIAQLAKVANQEQPSRVEVRHTLEASAPRRRAGAPMPALDLALPADPEAAFLLALRHPSGAITFHVPVEGAGRRGKAAAGVTVRFRVDFPQEEPEEITTERRGIVSKVVKGVVIAVSGKLADLFLPKLVKALEEKLWKNRRQGWLQVTQQTLADGNFQAADFSRITSPADRCLLFIHGTFSNTQGGFGDLAATKGKSGTDFLSSVAPVYGNRIFAFNHFSLSKTPEENAKELLAALPKQATFDVITHSRGGLVLRTLVERSADLGPNAKRFQLGKAVLVASPNRGTPLATPANWERCVGWLANLVEMFPENPVTLTLDFISEALVWLAHRASGGVPGLGAMDMDSDFIRQLNAATPPPPGAYSALVSNFQPEKNELVRLADAGFNTFFRGACDLVVPSEGGWRVGPAPTVIAAQQIGCFGGGGNLDNGIFHTRFFSRSETVDFLVEALEAKQHPIKVIDPATLLPARGLRAAAGAGAVGLPGAGPEAALPSVEAAEAAEDVRRVKQPAPAGPGLEADEVFQLFLIATDEPEEEALQKALHAAGQGQAPIQEPAKTGEAGEGAAGLSAKPEKTKRTALLLASFRNARAVERVVLRQAPRRNKDGEKPKTAGKRPRVPAPEESTPNWREIIGVNEGIKSYINGEQDAPPLPARDDLKKFGVELFDALFPNGVRRLYDVARGDVSLRGKRLGIVLTSMINWVADKPWEFAYDPHRQAFLASEDTNFTRNVLTGVPAEAPLVQPDTMRILVVVAQPVGLGLLSSEDEENVIRRGFRQLTEARLAEVDLMLSATADLLHKRIEFEHYDVVHFIGHGEYDEEKNEGYLLFEDRQGGAQRVSADSLRQILCHRGIQLVFLNACETGMVGRAQNKLDFNQGLAPKLIAGGIPAVVANQYKVLDVSATEFARRFYWSLAQGSSVGDAAREARVAVNYSIIGECIDWAVPVVYARNPSNPLFKPRKPMMPAREVTLTAAGRVVAPAIRIGLWDVNHAVPDLESIANRFNQAQEMYRFKVVDITAPMGTWRLVPGKNDTAQGFIDGKEVAAKLGSHVATLGIRRLFSITAFDIGGTFKEEGELSQLAMWNDDPDKRIALISGSGGLFEALNAQRDAYPVGRFIANCLASALSDMDDHPGPPQDCPNFFENKQRTIEERLQYTTGRQSFCDACRKKFSLPEKLAALQSILDAY